MSPCKIFYRPFTFSILSFSKIFLLRFIKPCKLTYQIWLKSWDHEIRCWFAFLLGHGPHGLGNRCRKQWKDDEGTKMPQNCFFSPPVTESRDDASFEETNPTGVGKEIVRMILRKMVKEIYWFEVFSCNNIDSLIIWTHFQQKLARKLRALRTDGPIDGHLKTNLKRKITTKNLKKNLCFDKKAATLFYGALVPEITRSCIKNCYD